MNLLSIVRVINTRRGRSGAGVTVPCEAGLAKNAVFVADSLSTTTTKTLYTYNLVDTGVCFC